MLDVSVVRSILQRMRDEDPNYRVFGADMHHYRLGATVPESKLRAFEAKYDIRLPEEYRDFLKHVGNGNGPRIKSEYYGANAGAGPYYGLMPLDEAGKYCNPQIAFPLVTIDGLPGGIELREKGYKGDSRFPGVIELCSQGCSGAVNLVVKGEGYGTIWASWEHNFYALPGTFGQWYNHWLNSLVETAIPILHRERRVAKISVGMPEAEVIALCGGEWKRSTDTLSSPDFATQFQLDEADCVRRIVAYSIYPTRMT